MNRRELEALAERECTHQQRYRCRLLCCGSVSCLAAGGVSVQETFEQIIKAHHLERDVKVVPTGCMGPCIRGPMVRVQQQGEADILYERVTPDLAQAIIEQHVLTDAPVLDHVLPETDPFFAKQKKVVLANSGFINPERLDEYVARGGYQALAYVLREMTPAEVCAEIVRSGLRGRGGAGYPTGVKWDMVRKATTDKKFVVANGDEGDPGAYMDRTLMESDPHLILEGMAIAGYAVGAEQGYAYVRGEYPVAARRLAKAIRLAERRGVLGSRVFDSDFSFRIDICIGAGAFVCGEETALMASIMGRRAHPVPRPPYPSQEGLWGYPTLLNNVETFGNVVPIIDQGADWYSSIGTAKSKGTKIFALTGSVRNAGLIEVPMGITLREIVDDIGGGIPNGHTFKAAQTGGPGGGCIPAKYLDTPVDYENLRKLGSMMGSGGLIVMDDTACMPDVARFFIEFCVDESCGKCTPCRVGTVQLYRILTRMLEGQARPDDITLLEELCQLMRETSLCGLGQGAPSPVLSTLRYFRHEYEALLSQPKLRRTERV